MASVRVSLCAGALLLLAAAGCIGGVPTNCHGHWLLGARASGGYDVSPAGNGRVRTVACRMTETGGQTLLQRNSNVAGWRQKNMTRPWKDYVQGFGAGDGYWIGLDAMHHVTKAGGSVRIDFTVHKSSHSGPQTASVTYALFKVGDASANYTLQCGNATASDGIVDAMQCGKGGDVDLNGQAFTTYDSDNDHEPSENCASHKGTQPGWDTWEDGAWWYNACGVGYGNADGRYYFGTVAHTFVGQWWPTYGFIYNGTVEMHALHK